MLATHGKYLKLHTTKIETKKATYQYYALLKSMSIYSDIKI